MKPKLIERLKEYYKLERFHVIWISLFCIFLNIKFGFKKSILLDYGLVVVVFILIQGTYYWKSKLNRFQEKIIDGQKILYQFKVFKLMNLCVLLVYPLFIIIIYYNNLLEFQSNKAWAAFAYIFGVAEYINYYHVQLMYDNKNDWQYLRVYKRLKTASLKKDLAENKI